MPIILGIVVLWFVIGTVVGVICWITDATKQRSMVNACSKNLLSFNAKVDALRISEMHDMLEQMKQMGSKNFGVLQSADGETLNICPKCGHSLRASPAWIDAALNCTNFRCHFTSELPPTAKNISTLRIV